jgi:hypothetical protein
MKRQDFIKAIRQDGMSFRADDISIDTGSEKFSGKGTIRISEGQFLVEVTLNDLTKAPTIKMGIFGRSQFWNVSGLIENEIKFHFQGMPSGQTAHYGYHSWKNINLSTRSMDLVPCGLDALTTAERKKWSKDVLKAHRDLGLNNAANAAVPDADPAETNECTSVEVSFYAQLRDFDLITCNGQTITTEKNDFLGGPFESIKSNTFHGEFQEWKFALIKQEKDLDIYFRSKPEYKSQGEEHDQRFFRAFLNSVAFTHAQHTWPFLTEYHRDGKLILDRVHLSNDVARSSHSPFTKRLAFDALISRSQWRFLNPLEKAYLFFSSNSKLSREIAHLLYLFRESSTSGVPKGIALLSLCSLFESLLHAIYDERIAVLNKAATKSFEDAKRDTLEVIRLKASRSENPTSFDRIINIVTGATSLRPKDKFKAIIEHWQLKPEDHWNEIFAAWERHRHPLSHRMSKGDESEESNRATLLAESRIGGAINCMILKLMNYAGCVSISSYEDKYAEI